MTEPAESTSKPVYRPDDKLKTEDAAVYCEISVSLLTKLRVTGGGPPFYKLMPGGRLVRYKVRDLDVWLGQARRKSTSDRGPQKRVRKARR